jgi:serine/threonine protein kinase
VSTENDISSALPDYLVERELGKGGMGLVFLGRHVRLGRLVAIKELPPTFATDPRVRERFSTEARTLATLSHPHIVPIYDYVEREGLCLIVMEELPGGTVWDRFTSTGLTPPTACAVVLACCAALQHAHDNGVLHLDVKPDNLMFSRDAAIKVTDFGISRVLSGDETLGTLDGQVLGTPAYMSPEQARGSELTPASDVYSAGVMLYELLSGHLPWTGAETATDLLLKRLHEDPRPLTAIAPQIPVPLADVVMKAIEREPENRHASAEDFGVAVASACADAWGPDWLDLAGVTIIGSDRLSLAARTTRQQSAVIDTGETPRITTTASSAPQTVFGTVLDGENRIAPETTATPAAGPAPTGTASPPQSIGVGTAPGATPPAAAAAPLEFQVVRAAGSAPRIEGANLKEIDRSAFVDVAETLGQRHRSGRLFALALLFVIGAVVTAGVLFAPPKNTGTLHRGDVRIAGFDVSRGRASFDFGKNLPIRVNNPSLALRTDRATLALSTAGVSLGKVSTPIANGSGVFKTGIQKYISAGSVNAQLELQSRSKRIAVQKFPVTARSKWYLTALGLGGLILLLGGFAYFEGALRPLRRGRRRISSLVSCAISAAVMGLGVAAFVSALGRADPTAAGLAAAALFSGIAGVLFGLAVRRRALRKGVHRAVKRAQTVAGVGN